MLKRILIVLAGVIAALFGYAALQPSEYTIAREIVVHAAPDAVFPYINDSKLTNEWMPWRDLDPSVQMSFSGPTAGVGSVSSWTSTGKMGVGKAEVFSSTFNQSVKTQLTYTEPMEMSQVAEISLTPTTNGTTVTWKVTGSNNLIGRVFCLVMNMDKVVGGEFEKGLVKLKTTVESGAVESAASAKH